MPESEAHPGVAPDLSATQNPATTQAAAAENDIASRIEYDQAVQSGDASEQFVVEDPDFARTVRLLNDALTIDWPLAMASLPEASWNLLTQQADQPAVPEKLGRFEIQEKIGSGAFGIVYKARDPELNRIVALKVPRPEVLWDAQSLSRFQAEASTTAQLSHPSIVPLFEAKLNGPAPYLASAFCPGPNLQQWLDDQTQLPTPTDAALFIATLSDAVHYAHEQGVIHRDLKPANVLLVSSGSVPESPTLGDFQPRLTDFGLARLSMDPQATQSGLLMGTPLYMAPEQAECRSDDIGPATDVFGLGAILYHLLTGAPPFAAESCAAVLIRLREGDATPVRELCPEIHADLATICMKCLEKSPGDRYSTAREIHQDLNRFLEGDPVTAQPIGFLQKLQRFSRRAARVPEAMSLVIAVTVVRNLITIGGLLLLILRDASPTNAEISEAFAAYALICFSADGFGIGAALRLRQRKNSRWLYWAAYGISVLLGWVALMLAVGVFPVPQWLQLASGARTLLFAVIAVLFAVQSLAWCFGDWARMNVDASSAKNRLARRTMLLAPIVATALFFRAFGDFPATPLELVGPSSSMQFDGKDDIVRIDDVGFTEGQPFTLEAWISPDEPHKGTVVVHPPVTVRVMASSGNAVKLRVELDVNGVDVFLLHAETPMSVAEWSHVAVTYDTREVALWINGQRSGFDVSLYESASDEATEADLDFPLVLTDMWPGDPTTFGRHKNGSDPFCGRIGEVRLSKSVTYRGAFTTQAELSVEADTQFLFHMNDISEAFQDAAGSYSAGVER